MIFSPGTRTVIVPLLGTTLAMLVEEAQEAQRAGADIIEWRVDMLFGEHPNFSFSQLGSEIIPQLVQATQIPLMLTIRTASQGGAVKVSEGRYRLLLAEMLDTLLQLRVPGDRIVVDIEYWHRAAPDLARRAQELGYTVVISDHNWLSTPEADILRIMYDDMLAIPGVVAKLAVTAHNSDDVDRLLDVTREVTEETQRMVIAVAMSEQGRRSRFEGWNYGSVATFAACSRPSAPGQPHISEILAVRDAPEA
ncbi:type I 3-dehydroquinate dehydratase [Arcanobacterium pinnipediorum]|uniref:3-dehydroquinate dehydratase n=1 Tax=Arcanobacterium pinnipediorum TaxID=1503041 RepID=A0ABY5AHX7_9ACTO|nr:type I 3-dehydroquinate dehydratase [Arcanobacterium pinnipediorum]USR79528.1 type I 3-dehydroquinate dehydratase [Arcanobacterium pinnipediorum]